MRIRNWLVGITTFLLFGALLWAWVIVSYETDYTTSNTFVGSDVEHLKTLEISHFIEHLFTLLTSNKYKNGLENRNMLSKLNEVNDSQLRTGGLVFAVIGFLIIWYLKS